MARSLVLHNETLHAAFGHHGGVVFSTMGDEMAVAFSSAAGAVRASVEAQRALMAAPWPAETGMLKVRMGLHTDEVALSDGQYASAPLRRCARLMAAAHGGQILMSDATEALVRSQLPDGATVLDLGEHRLRDLAGLMHIFQLVHPDLPGAFPALRTLDELPGNLPLQVSSFIGRARELGQTAAALREARVVTLTGVGGVVRPGWRCGSPRSVPRFGDGAWLWSWPRSAMPPAWTVPWPRCSRCPPGAARAPAMPWSSSCATRSCCWCSITVSICSPGPRR